jgi:hypothetical protein
VSKIFDGVLGKLGLTKAKKIEGNTKEKVDESYKESTAKENSRGITTRSVNSNPDENATNEEKAAAAESNATGNDVSQTINTAIANGKKLTELPLKIGKSARAVPQLLCLAYRGASLISASAKIVKAARYATFAMIILTLISSMRAGKATEAEASKGLDVLFPKSYPPTVIDPATGETIPNPDIGKNVFDSEIFRMVVLGADLNLSDLVKSLFIAGGFLGVLDTVINWMNDKIGKSAINATCKIANTTIINDTISGIIDFLSAPVFALAVMAITELVPIEKMAAAIVNMAIDVAAGADLTTGITGPRAGDIIFLGLAVIMGANSMNFGMRPSTSLAAIKKNMGDNAKAVQQQVALERYEARATPFDINNSHSFLGSIASDLARFMPAPNQPIFASFGKMLSVVPSSLGMLSNEARAAYSQPVTNYSEHRFNQCFDDAYKELGLAPDVGCVVRYVPFEPVDSEANSVYMETHNEIDEDGKPVVGSHLEKYKKYCTQRTDPWGSTSVAPEEQEDEPDWYTGKKCLEDNVENQMASEFVGYKVVQDIYDNVGEDAIASVTAPGAVAGDARALAAQVANHGNIAFVDPDTAAQLKIFSEGGTVYDSCGKEMTVSKHLLSALLVNAGRYKILVNNIGFREDRDRCEVIPKQHPAGTAVDLNNIEIIGGPSTGGSIEFPADLAIANQYASDFLAALPLNRGGIGQSDLGMNPVFPPGSVALNGYHLFPDGNNHLHIDARNRENIYDTE